MLIILSLFSLFVMLLLLWLCTDIHYYVVIIRNIVVLMVVAATISSYMHLTISINGSSLMTQRAIDLLIAYSIAQSSLIKHLQVLLSFFHFLNETLSLHMQDISWNTCLVLELLLLK